MTEPNQGDRLAALAARSSKPRTPAAAPVEEPTAPAKQPARRSWRPNTPSTSRLAATGASLVSFAAMVVAMGPLTVDAAESADADPLALAPLDLTTAPPAAPQVVVEVIPNYVSADGTPLTAEELAFISDMPAEAADAERMSDPASSVPPTAVQSAVPAPAAPSASIANAPAAAPATAPIAAPAATTAPAVAPAATPSTTVAPGIAAPTTAAPPTAAPTTAAPAPAPAPQPTPPPRSEASG